MHKFKVFTHEEMNRCHFYFYDRKNLRFQICLSNSKDWERKLMEALRLWKNLQVKAEPVEGFVTQADEVLTTQAETPMETLQTHKVRLWYRIEEVQ